MKLYFYQGLYILGMYYASINSMDPDYNNLAVPPNIKKEYKESKKRKTKNEHNRRKNGNQPVKRKLDFNPENEMPSTSTAWLINMLTQYTLNS